MSTPSHTILHQPGFNRFRLWAVACMMTAALAAYSDGHVRIDKQACTISKDGKTYPIHGKVRIVDSFEDIRVRIVDSFEDVDIKIVESFADDCGRVRIVESFEDVRVRIVDSFEDVRVKIVESFPGVRHDVK